MKSYKFFLVLTILCGVSAPSGSVLAATKVVVSKLKTNHDFEDKLVNGKYQYPDEATAKVDDDKILDDLIGVRKHFKDRLKESAERR